MKTILSITLATTCLLGTVSAGESLSDTLEPTSDSAIGEQSVFGAPYIKFARKNSDTLLPGYTVGTASYTHRFTSDFDNSELGELSSDQYSLWTPIAGINKEEFHLLAWLGYGASKYDVDSNSALNMLTERTMQSISMPVVFIHDISEQWIWGGMVMPSYSGTGGSSDNFSISAALGVGYSYSPSLELFAGVYYFNGFGDDLIIPGAAFIWRPAPRWEAYLLPPIGGISYSVNEKCLISLYGQYDAPEWHVQSDKLGPDRDISMKSLSVGAKVEYHVGSLFWAYAGAGVSMGQEMTIENSHNDTLQESDIDVSPFVQIGLNARF